MTKISWLISGILLSIGTLSAPLMSAPMPSTDRQAPQALSQNLPTIPFYLIRHGETDWNKQGKIQGQTDIPLNERGIEQARKAGLALKNKGIQKIYASNLKRARQTAEIIREVLGVKEPVQINPGLAERSMGKLEGHHYQDLGNMNMDLTRQLVAGSEPLNLFYKRAVYAIEESIHEKGVLIVTHGGVFGAFMGAIGFQNKRIDNAIPLYIVPPTSEEPHWSITKIK